MTISKFGNWRTPPYPVLIFCIFIENGVKWNGTWSDSVPPGCTGTLLQVRF